MNRPLTFALLLLWQITAAQTIIDYDDLKAKANEFFLNKLKSDNIVGVSAAIVMDGKMIWANGFGYADRDLKVPIEYSGKSTPPVPDESTPVQGVNNLRSSATGFSKLMIFFLPHRLAL